MAGGGNVSVIGANSKKESTGAYVTDNALHVKVIGGGGGGPTSDVNIASVGGNPVGSTVPVSGSVSITGSVTINDPIDVNVLSLPEPVSVDDNGGSLTVDSANKVNDPAGGTDQVFPAGAVRDDALAVLAEADGDYTNFRTTSRGALWTSLISSAGNAVVITAAGNLAITTTVEENAVVAAAHNVFPAGIVRDDALATLGVADGDWTDIRCNSRGAVWIKPDGTVDINDIVARSSITNLFNAQVFNNTTTNANSGSFDCTLYRWIFVYYTLSVANAPSNIRLIPQFTPDGGTTWCDYSVDQWVDLRFVPGQMTLNECVPLNYVIGKTLRFRAVATGTTASATFTLSLWVEGIN